MQTDFRNPKVQRVGAFFIATLFGIGAALALSRLLSRPDLETGLIAAVFIVATGLCMWHGFRSSRGYPLRKRRGNDT